MAYNFSAANKRALKVITKFGKDIIIVKKGAKGGLDNKGNVIPVIPDSFVNGIVTPLVQFKTKEIDGKSILMGDSYVLFHGDEEPQIDMHIEINSDNFRIVGIKPISSADNIVIYRKLQLRK